VHDLISVRDKASREFRRERSIRNTGEGL